MLPTSVGVERPVVAEQGGVRDGQETPAGGWGRCQNHSGTTCRFICDDQTHIEQEKRQLNCVRVVDRLSYCIFDWLPHCNDHFRIHQSKSDDFVRNVNDVVVRQIGLRYCAALEIASRATHCVFSIFDVVELLHHGQHYEVLRHPVPLFPWSPDLIFQL